MSSPILEALKLSSLRQANGVYRLRLDFPGARTAGTPRAATLGSVTPAERPLAVTHVAHTAEAGGAELALVRILAEAERGWDATLALPEGSLGVFAEVGEVNVSVVQAGAHQAPGASKASIRGAIQFGYALIRQARSLRQSGAITSAQVVHANSTRASVYTTAAMILSRKPLVVHLRDRMEPDAIGKLGHMVFKRIVAPRAHGVIANSHSTADTVRPLLKRHQFIEVVPSPIGVERAARPALTPERKVRVGMVARLDPWKGQHLLIDAFAKADIDSEAELILIGSPAFGHEGYLQELRKRAAEQGVRNITFTGFRHDIQQAIDELDICVQYSTRPEPLGQNVLQYLARAKTVIVADEGGPTEWITNGKNGVRVAPRDSDALGAQLASLVSDAGLRRRLAAAARESPGLMTDTEVAQAHRGVFLRAFSIATSNRKDTA